MKKKLCFFALLFTAVLFTSCKKDELYYQNSFENSYQKLISFKETSGNSYSYMVTQGSVFGSASQTTITVSNGKVTQRHFTYTSTTGMANVPATKLEWTENGTEINSHSSGAAALTLDEIYDNARSQWLIKRENAKAYLETNNDGLISSCGYVEDGCMDDCFIGIQIAYIKSL